VIVMFDEDHGQTLHGYQLVQLYLVEGRVVQVQVARNASEVKSFATASVLTPALAWTRLATVPAARWYEATEQVAERPSVLLPVADLLVVRAAVVLFAHGTGRIPTGVTLFRN
jgi:hypothetical protein